MLYLTRNINFRPFIYPEGIYYELNMVYILNNSDFHDFGITDVVAKMLKLSDVIEILG